MSEPVTFRKLRDVEEDHIRAAIALFEGNMTRSAEALGIDRRTLYRRAAALGIKTRRSTISELQARVNELEAKQGRRAGR
jgi:DNA-binding NtrC family response regulator